MPRCLLAFDDRREQLAGGLRQPLATPFVVGVAAGEHLVQRAEADLAGLQQLMRLGFCRLSRQRIAAKALQVALARLDRLGQRLGLAQQAWITRLGILQPGLGSGVAADFAELAIGLIQRRELGGLLRDAMQLVLTLAGLAIERIAQVYRRGIAMPVPIALGRIRQRRQSIQPSGGVATLPPRLGQRLLEFRQRVLALAPEADRGGVRPAFDERLPGFAAGL